MNGTANVKDPGSVEVTMNITMTVGTWKTIRDEMGDKYIPAKFRRMITALVNKVERTLYDESAL